MNPKNTLTEIQIKTNLEFTFIPFSDFLITEIWLIDELKDSYIGEIVIGLN